MFPLFVQQDVKFPMSLDVFDLCSEELQQKLLPARTKFKEIEDKKVEEAAVRQGKRTPRKTKQQIFPCLKWQFSVLANSLSI